MYLDFKYRGIQVTKEDIEFIQLLIKNNPDCSRKNLSQKLCREWNWRQPNGAFRDMVCQRFMLQLHRAGYITLPEKKNNSPNPFIERRKPESIQFDQTLINKKLSNLSLQIEIVNRTATEKIFNSLIHQYHYLGYTHPVGEHLKYIIYSEKRSLACIAYSSAVRHLKPRDLFIGWDKEKRRVNIRYIAYNTRFLILSWVKVKYLAFHLLSQISRRISYDWEKLYNHPIYLLETFVDTEKFSGICYRAANWIYVGLTTGRGKNAKTHKQNRSLKAIYCYPLCKDFREKLQE